MINDQIKLAVIGDPIAHSLSPIIHNTMLKELGINIVYDKFQVNIDRLDHWISTDEAKNLQGFNVTMPLKNSIIKYLSELSSQAMDNKAVNTVVRKNDKLYGHNTDGIGFIRSLECENIDLKTSVAILGAGGAAHAVANSLENYGANVNLYCRDTAKTEFKNNVQVHDWQDIYLNKHVNILINATPLGMDNKGQFSNFNFLEQLNPNTIICDLIYKPFETKLLKEAKSKNYKCFNGLNMLIHQAIVALELFLDTKLEIDKMYDLVKKEIKDLI